VTDTIAVDESEPGEEPASAPLLEVTDLQTWFTTPRGIARAVDGVSFSLDRGRTLGVVGESGSGKSVLARSIMNLLPSNVIRSGSVRFEGREILGLRAKEMQSIWGARMSMVFQDPMTSLNPVMKIGKQITESLRQHLDVDKGFAMETAEQLLRSVGIPEAARRLKEYPHQLSGGMRQRVMIAIALACGPELLFADEPTTALDVTVQAQILDLLAEQQRERYMAMVLVTHDLGVVAGRADEIAVMYAGRIVEHAPTRTLFTEMRHPYTQALLNSIPRLQYPSHTRLQAIPGRPPDLVNPPPGCPFAPRCPHAQPRCLEEAPPLATAPSVAADHRFACFYPVGTPEGDDALARNEAAGHTAAHARVAVPPDVEVDAPADSVQGKL
jgi:peptide/nickel transport system ATP-binding protein